MKNKVKINTTLYELVKCVGKISSSEKEAIEVIKHILNTRKVKTRKKSKLKSAA